MFHPEYYEQQHSRIIYKKIESVKFFKDIEHPVVRETLNLLEYKNKKGMNLIILV